MKDKTRITVIGLVISIMTLVVLLAPLPSVFAGCDDGGSGNDDIDCPADNGGTEEDQAIGEGGDDDITVSAVDSEQDTFVALGDGKEDGDFLLDGADGDAGDDDITILAGEGDGDVDLVAGDAVRDGDGGADTISVSEESMVDVVVGDLVIDGNGADSDEDSPSEGVGDEIVVEGGVGVVLGDGVANGDGGPDEIRVESTGGAILVNGDGVVNGNGGNDDIDIQGDVVIVAGDGVVDGIPPWLADEYLGPASDEVQIMFNYVGSSGRPEESEEEPNGSGGDDTINIGSGGFAIFVVGDGLIDFSRYPGESGEDTITVEGGTFPEGPQLLAEEQFDDEELPGFAEFVFGDGTFRVDGADDVITIDGITYVVVGDGTIDGAGGDDEITVNGVAEVVIGDGLIQSCGEEQLCLRAERLNGDFVEIPVDYVGVIVEDAPKPGDDDIYLNGETSLVIADGVKVHGFEPVGVSTQAVVQCDGDCAPPPWEVAVAPGGEDEVYLNMEGFFDGEETMETEQLPRPTLFGDNAQMQPDPDTMKFWNPNKEDTLYLTYKGGDAKQVEEEVNAALEDYYNNPDPEVMTVVQIGHRFIAFAEFDSVIVRIIGLAEATDVDTVSPESCVIYQDNNIVVCMGPDGLEFWDPGVDPAFAGVGFVPYSDMVNGVPILLDTMYHNETLHLEVTSAASGVHLSVTGGSLAQTLFGTPEPPMTDVIIEMAPAE